MGRCKYCGEEADCALDTSALGTGTEYVCDACRLALDDYFAWRGDIVSHEAIICPWCGHAFLDHTPGLGRNELTCPVCEGAFVLDFDIEVTLSSRKRDCDYGGPIPGHGKEDER